MINDLWHVDSRQEITSTMWISAIAEKMLILGELFKDLLIHQASYDGRDNNFIRSMQPQEVWRTAGTYQPSQCGNIEGQFVQ